MESWIRENFICDIKQDGTEVFRFIRTNTEGKTFSIEAPLAWFIQKFGGIVIPPTATALKAVDPANTMGWHAHFDEWVRQGIIQP